MKQVCIDLVSIQEMTRDQLEQHVDRLRKELELEREERNFFQLERDKINTFWEISKNQLKNCVSKCAKKDHETEEAEIRHQQEIKIYKQKLKHLLYEHQDCRTELKSETVVALNIAKTEFCDKEKLYKQDQVFLKSRLKGNELSHIALVKQMQKDNEETFHKLRNDFECQLSIEREVNNQKLTEQYESLELRRKNDLHEMENQKSHQTKTLKDNHEKSFTEMKNYYNDITLNNLALINTLKDQVEKMKEKEERLEKQNLMLSKKNSQLTQPLNDLEREKKKLTQTIKNRERDVHALQHAKQELKKTIKNYKTLELEHEILNQRYKFVENERDELYNKFVSALHEIQKKCGLKNALLESRLSTLGTKLEMPQESLNKTKVSLHEDTLAEKNENAL